MNKTIAILTWAALAQLSIGQSREQAFDSWPDQSLVEQAVRLPTWNGKPHPLGAPQGSVTPAKAYTLEKTILSPARVSWFGRDPSARRGVEAASFLVAPSFPEGEYLLEVLDDQSGGQNSANDVFNVRVDGLGLQCGGRANGIYFRGAQISECVRNHIDRPSLVGIYVAPGSRNVDLSKNDIQGEFKASMSAPSKAAGMVVDRATGCGATGGNYFGLEKGIVVLGSVNVNFRDQYFEHVKVPIVFADSSRCNTVTAQFEAVDGGCIADFSGAGYKSRPGTGNVVSGVIAKTKDPYYIDRDGNKVPISASAWALKEMAGNQGWRFTIEQ